MKKINEVVQELGVDPLQVIQWKKAIQEDAKRPFEMKRGPKPVVEHQELARPYHPLGGQ